MRRLAPLMLIALSLAATAQTYRWIDPVTGKTMYTDHPPPGKVKQSSRTGADGKDDGPTSPTVRRAAENFPVTLYTSSDCAADCKNARDLLNRRGVPFSEKLVQSPEDFAELKALVGDAYVPTLKVGRQTQKGFQTEAYNSLLDLAGYPAQAPFGSKPASTPQAAGKTP